MVGRHSGRGIVLYHYHYHSLLLYAGLPCYTIGQKTGLSLGNASYYVAKKNCHNNEITVVCNHISTIPIYYICIFYVCMFIVWLVYCHYLCLWQVTRSEQAHYHITQNFGEFGGTHKSFIHQHILPELISCAKQPLFHQCFSAKMFLGSNLPVFY